MTRKAAKIELSRIPPPGPDWKYSPPRKARVYIDPCDPSKGKIDVVEIDAFSLTMADEMYRALGVRPV